MADIALVYDRSETDEMGIKLTAQKMGIDLTFLPFHKVAVGFGNSGFSYRGPSTDYTSEVENVKVILNRTQSKNRRIFASAIFEAMRKQVLNPLDIELTCYSKIRTLLCFVKAGINIPKTVFVPSNVKETMAGGRELDNSEAISKIIADQLGDDKIVIKPDAGTHGSGVTLVEGKEQLTEALTKLSPTVINPSGVLAQEYVPKWFYDLRILVGKERDRSAYCHPTALARGGLKEFRTNTFLGNMVFGVKLPASVQKDAVRCAESLGSRSEAWLIALDALPYTGSDRNTRKDEIKPLFDALQPSFDQVRKAKQDPAKKEKFAVYSRNVEQAYAEYMSTEAYSAIKAIIEQSLEKNKDRVLFHEANACPEFWEQTRIVAGDNLAESLLRCAESLAKA